MKIDKKVIADKDNIIEWIVLSALTQTLNDKEFNKFLESTDWHNKDAIDIQLKVEGVELNLVKVCEEWLSQVDRMLNEKAVELLSKKFAPAQDFIQSIEKTVRRQAKEKLGLEPDEYDY